MQKFLLSFSLLFLLHSVKATHNRAGEILYKRIAPFTQVVNNATVQVYTYSITVIKYTDDGLTVADRCVDTVYFGDGSKGIAPRINGLSSSCSCGTFNGNAVTCGSLIVNNPGYKVKYNVYSVTHTYASPGSYLVSSNDPNRNQGVHNIPNSVNVPFVIESLLVINSLTDTNSSPVLTNPPIDQATVGVCFYHDMGATDADGDSLSYEITTCRAPGYFHPELGAQNTFTINPVTGILAWCTPQFLDEYNIALIVKEWRKNSNGVYQQIGYVLRDMQVLVKYGVVGIHDIERNIPIALYPNPFNNMLEISMEQSQDDVKITVFSNDGKQVFSKEFSNMDKKMILMLSDLEAGVYTMNISTGSATFYRKMVKK